MYEHVIGILVIAVPFLVLLIWVFRHNNRIDEDRKLLLDKAAEVLGGKRADNRYDFNFRQNDIDFNVGIAYGGENDPTMLFVSCHAKPFADGVIYIFAQGINRWVSKKLASPDSRFNSKVCYQLSHYQNHPASHDLAEQIVNDADVRQAMLAIKATEYSHLYMPGDWADGSLSKKIGSRFTDTNDRLMAYATNPKAKHFEPNRIRKIAESLTVVADKISSIENQN